jgi:POT family proton-dependent oligopeptide transporter
VWLFLSYVLQSIGELLIMPIGYAMIGKLAPKQYQGVMMGSWMLVTGLASLFAGDFSGMIPELTGTTAIATNPGTRNCSQSLVPAAPRSVSCSSC